MSKFNMLPNNANMYNTTTNQKVHDLTEEIAQMKGEIDRLDLITEAMWTFIKEKGYSEEDLVKRITELDDSKKQKKKALEDGERPEQDLCPFCHVPLQNNGKIADRCIYCGHEIITSPFK